MDTSVLAAIIGGIAAVLGVGMAVIAIFASRAMKESQANQHQNIQADEHQLESPTDSVFDPLDKDPNAFVDPFAESGHKSNDSANVFSDPFEEQAAVDKDESLEWGSTFGDPKKNPDEQWGFDADETTRSSEFDSLKDQPESNGGG